MNYSFPEDMENRRLADLQRWALRHPNDPMVPLLMQQVTRTEPAEQESDMGQGSSYGWLREKQPGSKEKKKLNSGRKLSTGTPGPMNKWDTVSTLELLNEMKRFQDSLNKMAERGIRVTACMRWPTIARHLPNRCGLESAKFARSCQVHFANLCRVYKGQKRTTKDVGLEPAVQEAMDEYFQYAAAGNPTYPPILKRLEMNNNLLQRGENEAADRNAMIVRNPYMQIAGHTRLDTGEKNSRIAAARRVAFQKHLSRAPEKMGYKNKGCSPTEEWKTSARPSSSDNEGQNQKCTWDGSHYRMMDEESSSWDDSPDNKDVIEPEGAAAGRYQRHQEVNYAATKSVRSGMNRWDLLSTLELLAAMMKFEECRKITGAKCVNKWERVASQLPNRWKLDPFRYSRSCKAHYHELLRAYKKESSTSKRFPDKALPDEVRARLEEWLQFSGSHLRNVRHTETPRVLEKKNMASERGVKAALFSPVLTENSNDKRMRMKTNAGQYEYVKSNGGDAVNHGKDGLIKTNDGLPKCTWKGFNHETSQSSDNESSWDDCMHVQSNEERNMEKDKSMRMQKRFEDLKGKQKKSVTQKIPDATNNVLNGDEMTRNATDGKFQQLDGNVKGKGVYKAYTASQYTTSLIVRSRDLDSRGRVPKGKEKKSTENAWETGISDKLLRRKMMKNAKLKHNRQADVTRKELYKPYKPFSDSHFNKSRDLESKGKGPTLHSNVDSDDTSDSDNNSSSPDDASEVEGDECFTGLKKRSRDQNFEKRKKSLKKTIVEKTSTTRKIVVSGRQMTSGKLQQSEVDIEGRLSPRKLNFTAGLLEDPRRRDVDGPDKSSQQNRLDTVSDNESSWDDSMHLDDDNQMKRRDSRRFKMRWRGLQQKVGNTSEPGKKIVNLLSSGKVQKVDEICNPLKVDEIRDPLWDRSMERDKDRDLNRGTKSPLRSSFNLGSDQTKADENESSWDDSMHLDDEDDKMEGDETSRMKKKRMRDRQAKLKKSSAGRILARTFPARRDVRKFPGPWIQIDN